MKVTLGERTLRGRALDLRGEPVDPGRILDAINDVGSSVVSCPRPRRIHSFVGRIEAGMHLSLRSALAAAARSRGMASSFAEQIAALDRSIEAIEVEPIDLVPVRRRAAEAGADVAALRERVAHLRGRLDAEREAGGATERSRAALREAITALSEAETEELAAQQALADAERDARAVRDRRDRRLRLVDERDNLARRARTELATRLYPQFRRALDSLPVATTAGERPAEYEGDPSAAALAAARIAAIRAPVVLVDGPFTTAVAARAALDAPVVLV
ncbi:MAG: hypothetical protein ACQEQY_05320 [Halobacteriota archaeon]